MPGAGGTIQRRRRARLRTRAEGRGVDEAGRMLRHRRCAGAGVSHAEVRRGQCHHLAGARADAGAAADRKRAPTEEGKHRARSMISCRGRCPRSNARRGGWRGRKRTKTVPEGKTGVANSGRPGQWRQSGRPGRRLAGRGQEAIGVDVRLREASRRFARSCFTLRTGLPNAY